MYVNRRLFYLKIRIFYIKKVRPFLQREKTHEQKSCIAIHPQTNQIVLGDRRTFKYDFVFGPKTLQVRRKFVRRKIYLIFHFQEELYRTSVEPMLNNVFDGYNVTIFAYGQTVI